ncbi:MAG: 30S ribosomal protein S12 methylthiotransferase RimO [Eubacteriales bacterium]
MSIKVGFVSLGCPKNLVNTETMLARLVSAGFEIVAEDVDADVIVVNTCAFIESAKKEAIDNILDVAWLKENHTLKGIVVAGCLPERYRDEVMKELPEVDAIIGVGSIDDICEAVTAAYEGRKFSSFGDKNTVPLGGERVITTPEYFAYLQIAEGCDNCCSYCAIPSIRGRFRSRPMSEIIDEARDLASLGVKELCVIAQDTTRYGEDLYGVYSLDSLVHELSQVDGIEWIRLLYCYPDRITDSLIDEIASNPKVVKYLDIPIQHISTPVLNRMNRRDSEESIREVISKLRSRIPGIYLRTTVMTGFPGETNEDFDKLLAFVKETRFERLGAFVYSREEGTPAYDLPDQVPEKLKRKRYELIMREQRKIHAAINKTSVGKTLRVINEGYDQVAESYYGRSFADAPDIDGKIYYSSPRRLRDGEFVNVLVQDVIDYDLTGKVVE